MTKNDEMKKDEHEAEKEHHRNTVKEIKEKYRDADKIEESSTPEEESSEGEDMDIE